MLNPADLLEIGRRFAPHTSGPPIPVAASVRHRQRLFYFFSDEKWRIQLADEASPSFKVA